VSGHVTTDSFIRPHTYLVLCSPEILPEHFGHCLQSCWLIMNEARQLIITPISTALRIAGMVAVKFCSQEQHQPI
jgi:hypothetical protein